MMRDYVGTFWRSRFSSSNDEYLVVSEKDGQFVVLEMTTQTFHPAEVWGWDDTLWMHRHYHGQYFDNMTLEPVKRLKSSRITALES